MSRARIPLALSFIHSDNYGGGKDAMIENLKGVYETVNFKKDTNLRLYENDIIEDYPPHWHLPIEIIMPIENEYYVECLNKKIVLKEGDIVLLAPGCLHTISSPKDAGLRIIFQVDPTALRGIKEVDSIMTFLSPVYVITPETSSAIYEDVRKLLLDIREEYKSNALLSEASIYSKVLQMLVLIGRNLSTEHAEVAVADAKRQEYAEKFMKICDYISVHCTEDLKLEEIADMAGFSKFHFSRLFKQFTSVSFYQYLSQNRIHCAEQLLVFPENSITTVAYNCGFTSVSAFIRMFKIVNGVTPSEFRNMYIKHD